MCDPTWHKENIAQRKKCGATSIWAEMVSFPLWSSEDFKRSKESNTIANSIWAETTAFRSCPGSPPERWQRSDESHFIATITLPETLIFRSCCGSHPALPPSLPDTSAVLCISLPTELPSVWNDSPLLAPVIQNAGSKRLRWMYHTLSRSLSFHWKTSFFTIP